MEVSGGHFLPPVQKLVATTIFAPSRAKMQIESYIVHQKRKTTQWVVFLFYAYTVQQIYSNWLMQHIAENDDVLECIDIFDKQC